MIYDNLYSPEAHDFTTAETEKSRKPYRKPRLEELGTLLDLTLGGSPGVGDSGVSHSERPPSAPKKGKLNLNDPVTGNDSPFTQPKPKLKP